LASTRVVITEGDFNLVHMGLEGGSSSGWQETSCGGSKWREIG